MKSFKLLSLIVLGALSLHVQAQNQTGIIFPLGGNAYSSNQIEDRGNSRTITNKGITNWTNSTEFITAFVRVAKPGTLSISMDGKVSIEGQATLGFTINNKTTSVNFDEKKPITGKIGEWNIKDTGYVAIKISGISKTKNQFPSITNLLLSGTAVDAKTAYVPNNEGGFFHWGRRGPSVHLNYLQPDNVNAEWYYNEITVPVGQDKIGSYFMACGFGEGYFGMQVNSDTDRHILFSVWSPFKTDDPKSIPESHKIKMLKKGTDVTAKDFGGEGSGGQSFLNFRWKAGNTYKFLLHGKPGNDSTTTYTAYFFTPETNSWRLIASFKRPITQTYLKRFHSFLENFSPEQGDKSRMGTYNNQWICDDKGNWIELTKARFTTDNTGMKGYRMDFAGGVINGSFYLKDGGFFNNYTVPKTIFSRPATGKKPAIDFSKLP